MKIYQPHNILTSARLKESLPPGGYVSANAALPSRRNPSNVTPLINRHHQPDKYSVLPYFSPCIACIAHREDTSGTKTAKQTISLRGQDNEQSGTIAPPNRKLNSSQIVTRHYVSRDGTKPLQVRGNCSSYPANDFQK